MGGRRLVLSAKQIEAVSLLAEGKTYAAIAAKLVRRTF